MALSPEEKEDLAACQTMRFMVQTAGWGVYSKILEEKIGLRRMELERPAENVMDLVKAEQVKGALMMLRLMLALPADMIAQAERLEKLQREDPEGDLDSD